MKAKELLSILISIEDDISVKYDLFCMGDITHKAFQKKSEQYIKKQLELINQFKSASDFVQSIADKAEYIEGSQYRDKYRNLAIPVIEYNELIELAAKYDKK